MQIIFIKLSGTQHELRIVRADGTADSRVCETRSFILHDLTHLAFEVEANVMNGFWGSIAGGRSLIELSDQAATLNSNSEMLAIERTVAILQSLGKGLAPEDLVRQAKEQPGNFEWAPREWFELSFIERVQRRLQKLLGHWRATNFGESMSVDW